jgi:hypothetical protein
MPGRPGKGRCPRFVAGKVGCVAASKQQLDHSPSPLRLRGVRFTAPGANGLGGRLRLAPPRGHWSCASHVDRCRLVITMRAPDVVIPGFHGALASLRTRRILSNAQLPTERSELKDGCATFLSNVSTQDEKRSPHGATSKAERGVSNPRSRFPRTRHFQCGGRRPVRISRPCASLALKNRLESGTAPLFCQKGDLAKTCQN